MPHHHQHHQHHSGGGNSVDANNSYGSAVGSGNFNKSNNFSYAPTTLSLDLPQATDLSFTGKMSSLGLSDLEGKLRGEGNGGASSADAGSNNSFFATNGVSKNGDC